MCAKTNRKPAATAEDGAPTPERAPLDPDDYARILASSYSGGPLFA